MKNASQASALGAFLPAPRAVLFDWDNTLVNTWPTIHEALTVTFKHMGREPWSLEKTKLNVRRSMRDSFPDIFGPQWQEAAEIYQAHFRSIHLARMDPLPGAEEVIKMLSMANVYSAVVSNKKGVNLRKETAHLNWDRYFNKIVGADDAPRDKPHADMVHLALKESGIEPGRDIWFVGDSEIDLECAANCNCIPILFGEVEVDYPLGTTAPAPGRYLGLDFELHVPDHRALLDLIACHTQKR